MESERVSVLHCINEGHCHAMNAGLTKCSMATRMLGLGACLYQMDSIFGRKANQILESGTHLGRLDLLDLFRTLEGEWSDLTHNG